MYFIAASRSLSFTQAASDKSKRIALNDSLDELIIEGKGSQHREFVNKT
jgi:hypothetical protein